MTRAPVADSYDARQQHEDYGSNVASGKEAFVERKASEVLDIDNMVLSRMHTNAESHQGFFKKMEKMEKT